MAYYLRCMDKPNASDVRMANREAHLAYLKEFEDKAIAVGPIQTEDRTGMIGSLLIMDFANRAEAEDFAANDPYAKAGLFAQVDIGPWKQVYPKA